MKRSTTQDFSITLSSDSQKTYTADQLFVTSDFGILNNSAFLVNNLLKKRQTPFLDKMVFHLNQPYRLKEARIVMMLSGEVHLRHNLTEYTLRPGNVLVVPVKSIVQLISLVPGTEFRMIGMNNNFLKFPRKEEHLEYYLDYRQNILMSLSAEEKRETENFFSLIWQTVHHTDFRKEVVQSLLVALIQNLYYIRKVRSETGHNQSSHQEEVFNRFLDLVNAHKIAHRTVGFYADKLCLTPRYLNTVIRQTSQRTVMDWINEAVILEAKVMLRHNDVPVYRISDELNFANPSFFSKFFKRITGVTPVGYRRLA